MSKHMPGPWEWHYRDDADAPGSVVAVGYPNHPDRPHAVAMCPRYGKQDWEANARLIAAAPDMLEACREALYASVNETTYPDGPCLPRDVRDDLRAAIAKAEGRES